MEEPFDESQPEGPAPLERIQEALTPVNRLALGTIVLIISISLFWWNEGRVDLHKVVKSSRPVNANGVDRSANGKLISVTGGIESENLLGDAGFLEFGPYIQLNRNVETYAWVEREMIEVETKYSGRTVEHLNYSYRLEWTDTVADSDSFKQPGEHQNPKPSHTDRTYTVQRALIGSYRFNPQLAALPTPFSIRITRDSFIPSPGADLRDDYIHIGGGTLESPNLGDTRISYTAVEAGMTGTLFGKLRGDFVEAYTYGKDKRLYEVRPGDRETALAQIEPEILLSTWIYRVVCLIALWLGLCLAFGPANEALALLPAFYDAKREVVGGAMLGVSFALLLLIAGLSAMLHHVVVIILFVLAVGALICVPVLRRDKSDSDAVFNRLKDTLSLKSAHLSKDTPSPKKVEASWPPVSKPKARKGKIRFECEKCGTHYSVSVSLAGRKARCKKCQHKFYIPLIPLDDEPSATVFDSSRQ